MAVRNFPYNTIRNGEKNGETIEFALVTRLLLFLMTVIKIRKKGPTQSRNKALHFVFTECGHVTGAR